MAKNKEPTAEELISCISDTEIAFEYLNNKIIAFVFDSSHEVSFSGKTIGEAIDGAIKLWFKYKERN